MAYNTISIPLVYTQVVCIATYTYFLIALISNQTIKPEDTPEIQIHFDYFGFYVMQSTLDFIPFILILQFIFYMGWLKVAEALMNPFGDDDDDFDVNSMIDRNLQMSYLIVDEMHNDHPELLKDQYWDEIPQKLPDKAKHEDSERSSFVMETDMQDFEVKNRTSIFGKENVKVLPVVRESTFSREFFDEVIVDEEKGSISISNIPSATHTPVVENLKPDANIISEVYKRIENVEEEQDEINENITRKRRKTKIADELDDRSLENELNDKSSSENRKNYEREKILEENEKNHEKEKILLKEKYSDEIGENRDVEKLFEEIVENVNEKEENQKNFEKEKEE